MKEKKRVSVEVEEKNIKIKAPERLNIGLQIYQPYY